MKDNKNRDLANDILRKIGGNENISNSTHCATRLRLVLKEDDEEMVNRVKEIPGVIDVVRKGGQFQIVIGNSVNKVYTEFRDLAGIDGDNKGSDGSVEGNILERIIATMSAVFAPFIYVLAAAGMIQGALIVLSQLWPAIVNTGTYQVFDVISWSPFVFLPIFIAITASKHFKTDTFTAVFANAVLVAPGFTELAQRAGAGEAIQFLGFQLNETVYTSTVIPAILLVWFLSYLERFLDRILPEAVERLFTPLISILIAVPLTILIIGPISATGANIVAAGYTQLSEAVPALAGILVGGLWQFFVLMGVHWGITPVILSNHQQYGMDTFQVYQTIAVVAQIGAALAVFLKARNDETRNVSLSATVTGIFGITEPAIYGVNLRYKKPFVYGIIAGALGSFVTSFFGSYSYVYTGLPGPITILNTYSSENPSSFWGVLIGVIIAIIVPIILVQLFGYGDDSVEEVDSELSKAIDKNGNIEKTGEVEDASIIEVFSPINGTIVPLSEVEDPVFSSGAMGPGVAIEPLEQKITAPFDGIVTVVADTKHAIGLTSKEGVELLIHVGLDTVELEGQGFSPHVEVGQNIKRGDLLMEFNINTIEAAGYPTVIPIIVTNADDFKGVSVTQSFEMEDTLITIIK